MKRIDQNIYEVKDERLPKAAKGCRLAVLADIHNNRFGENDNDLLAVVKDFAPDLILIPGDLIVGERGAIDFEPVLFLLRKLRKIAPVYYSEGNHEEILDTIGPEASEQLRAFYGRCWEEDVEVLKNESIVTPQGIRIYGLSLSMLYYRRARMTALSMEALDQKLGLKDPEEYAILLAHHPAYFPQYALWGANLVVSGHQHGGMVRLPKIGGVISPQLALFPKYDAGEYRELESTMILSRGLGSHTIDLRFLGNAPEFVGIVLDS
ncbi:MAG: metallophosphoesterase [Lachnospiraceae bacterium]|nr:metallophosphoesterase [Lachnospiraceae bacterium]